MTTLNLRYYNQVADDYDESGAHCTAEDYRALIAEVERLTEVVTDLTTEKFINDQQALDPQCALTFSDGSRCNGRAAPGHQYCDDCARDELSDWTGREIPGTSHAAGYPD